ncbi:SCF-associated factor 1, partial [Bienertia sinuspersici]
TGWWIFASIGMEYDPISLKLLSCETWKPEEMPWRIGHFHFDVAEDPLNVEKKEAHELIAKVISLHVDTVNLPPGSA